MTPEDVARALVWIGAHRHVELHQAVLQFGADLDRPDVLPAEVFEHLQATRAQKNRRRHERIDAAATEAAKQLPAFIRLDPLAGRPMTWTQPDRPTLAAPSWLRCHTVPDEDTLNDPEVRRQIHAAAALAGITGPQRVARAIETGEYDRMLEHHADIEAYKREGPRQRLRPAHRARQRPSHGPASMVGRPRQPRCASRRQCPSPPEHPVGKPGRPRDEPQR